MFNRTNFFGLFGLLGPRQQHTLSGVLLVSLQLKVVIGGNYERIFKVK